MTEPAPAPIPARGLFARAVGMFTAPKATFQSVVATPRPAAIMFLAIAIIGLSTAGPQFTASGRQLALETQVQAREKATGQPISDDQVATLEKIGQYTPYITLASVLIITPVIVMIFAGLYWVIFNAILGGTATFRQVLTIVAHSSIVGAVGTAIGTPIMYAQGKLSQVGPFNLGVLAAGLDPDSFLHHFLGGISVFQIWGIIVTSIGLGVLYRRKTGGIATTLFVLYLAFVAAGAYFLGRFMA